MAARILVVAAAIMGALAADAQAGGFSSEQQDVWDTRDGLASTTVQALARSRSGYLLLGLHGAASRFDGVRFTPLPGFPSIRPDVQVRSVYEDADGTVWLALLDGGLVRVRSGLARTYTTADGLPSDNIADVCRTPDGTLWVGATNGLGKLEGDRFVPLAAAAPVFVLQLACAADGTVWVATGRAQGWRVRAGVAHPLAAALAGRTTHSVHVARDGDVWFGVDDGAAAIRRDGAVHVLALASDAPVRRVSAIADDADGRIWLGTWGAGIVRVDRDGKLSRYDGEDGLPSGVITSIDVDELGDAWIGTAGGLVRLHDRAFRLLGPRDRGPTDQLDGPVWRLGADTWVGSQGGGLALVRESGVVARYTTKDGLPGNTIVSLAQDDAGRLLVGTTHGLARRDGDRWTTVDLGVLPRDADVWWMYRARDGAVWIHASHQLVRHTAAATVAVEAFPRAWRGTLFESPDGSLHAAGGGQLHRFDGHRFVPERAVPSLDERAPVYVARATADGTVWIGASTGLFRIDARGVERIGAAIGLDTVVMTLVEDGRGFVWAGTRRGLFRVPIADASAARVLWWGPGSGLEGGDFSYPAWPRGVRAQDGALWFASNAGLAVVDPADVERRPSRPRVAIEGVAVDGQTLAFDGVARVPPGPNRVVVTFTALGVRDARSSRFQFRLDGFDRGWVDAGDARMAAYSNTPAGTYTFRVRAAAPDGPWSERDATVTLAFAPRLLERWSVRLALAALLIAGPTLVTIALRNRGLRLKAAARRGERERIARDLHDTLEQSYAGIILHLKAIEQRTATESPAREHVRSARDIVRHMHADTRHFLWDLRRERPDRPSLVAALRALVDQFARLDRPIVELSVQGDERPVDADVETCALRVAQEAVTNAVKHAEAERIEVDVAFDAAGLTLTVVDDGRGFDAAGASRDGRLGMTGMRERARHIGAALAITSGAGDGTRVELRWNQEAG